MDEVMHMKIGCVVMAAGIDAAGNLDLQLADFLLACRLGKLPGDFLSDRDRARIGQGAEISAGASDNIANEPADGTVQAIVDKYIPAE